MDEDRLLDELEKEYPELAELYNHFHAGDVPTERVIWEYARGGCCRSQIEKAKDKYLIIFQDMGLFKSE